VSRHLKKFAKTQLSTERKRPLPVFMVRITLGTGRGLWLEINALFTHILQAKVPNIVFKLNIHHVFHVRLPDAAAALNGNSRRVSARAIRPPPSTRSEAYKTAN
jgi:hypothetical protein